MTTEITDVNATEGSTFAVTVSFLDADGNSVAPVTMSWTLTDINGVVINDREDVVISNPESTETIVLYGDDLELDHDVDDKRVIKFEGTYTSDLGIGLPFVDQVIFTVSNIAFENKDD